MMLALGRHVVDSTFFVLVVAVLVLCCRKRGAAARHTLWLLADAMFVVPMELFSVMGSSLRGLLPPTSVSANMPVALSRWTTFESISAPSKATGGGMVEPLVLIWLIGTAILLLSWLRKIWASLQLVRSGGESEQPALPGLQQRIGLCREVRLQFSDSVAEPVLVGFWRPVVLIPTGLSESLSPEELESVILHELAHAKRWDNWTAAFVHAVACIFWFHPLLWWIEKRMHRERELASDEMVVRYGAEPDDYVASILKVCRLHLSVDVAGVSEVCGSNLKNRMEAIMSLSPNRPLLHVPKALLGSLIAAAVIVPLTLGFFATGSTSGQTTTGAQDAGKSKTGSSITCMYGVAYPEGTVIQVGDSPQQMCARVPLPGRDENDPNAPRYIPTWIRTSEAIRARGATIVHLPVPPVPVCAPKPPVEKGLCSCEDGGESSSGAIVNSAKGPYQLRCGKDGNWIQTTTLNVKRK